MERLIGTPLLLAALLATVACGDEKGDATPYAAQVAAAIPKLEKTTGLTFKTPPKFEARSKEEVRQFLERAFSEELPAEEMEGGARAYKRFGLLPDTLDMRAFMLSLLSEQVVGYYDPRSDVLYIVEGSPEELVSMTVSHELVHALQDQYISLDSIQRQRGDNDRQMAAQAAIEGQATFEQLASALGGGTMIANLPGGWERVRQLIRENNASMPIFSTAPTLIQETLLFPYLSGAEFMRLWKEKNAGRPPFGDMPVSTEQVLHEDRFFGRRDQPTRVTLPALTSGKAVYENNLGEFETRLFLYEHLKDRDAAFRGAAGWDGDRYVLFDLPRGGEGLAWVSVWDTSVDAAEFFDLLDAAVQKRTGVARPAQPAEGARTYSARGRTFTLAVTDVGGRPVVTYVDVPAGTGAAVLDPSRITLEQ